MSTYKKGEWSINGINYIDNFYKKIKKNYINLDIILVICSKINEFNNS